MDLMFEGYGRYVDDYFVISLDKDKIVNSISIAKDYLKDNLEITLHPKKIYIQPSYYGVKFTGGVVKDERTYISNTILSNICMRIVELNKNFDIQGVINSLNSYWGFLKQHRTYTIKYNLVRILDNNFFNFIDYNSKKFKWKGYFDEYKTLIIKLNKYVRNKNQKN